MSTEQEKRFQEIQNKNQKVAEGAIQVNTRIETARETRTKLIEAAQKKFGESDLEKLKAKKQSFYEQNELILKEFETKVQAKSDEVKTKIELIQQIQQK